MPVPTATLWTYVGGIATATATAFNTYTTQVLWQDQTNSSTVTNFLIYRGNNMTLYQGARPQLQQLQLPEVLRAPAIRPARTLVEEGFRHDPRRMAEREAAILKATRLLESMLDLTQLAEWREFKRFVVRGKSGQLYGIHRGTIGNVEELEQQQDGTLRVLRRLCVHPADPMLPPEDVMLAQMLHLKVDDRSLVARANLHPNIRQTFRGDSRWTL